MRWEGQCRGHGLRKAWSQSQRVSRVSQLDFPPFRAVWNVALSAVTDYGQFAQDARTWQANIKMEVDVMRELNKTELSFVSGGTGQCTPGNSYGGVSDTTSLAQDLINIYEAVVSATSHVIERVANAL